MIGLRQERQELGMYRYHHGVLPKGQWAARPAVNGEDPNVYLPVEDLETVTCLGPVRLEEEREFPGDRSTLEYRLVRHDRTGFEGWMHWFSWVESLGRGFELLD